MRGGEDVATTTSSKLLNLAPQYDGDLGGGRDHGGRGRGRCRGGGRGGSAVPVSTGLAGQQQRPSRRLHLRGTGSSERHLRGTVFVRYSVYYEFMTMTMTGQGFIKRQHVFDHKMP